MVPRHPWRHPEKKVTQGELLISQVYINFFNEKIKLPRRLLHYRRRRPHCLHHCWQTDQRIDGIGTQASLSTLQLLNSRREYIG